MAPARPQHWPGAWKSRLRGARCRLWAGQLPPLTPEARAALVQHREEALWHTLTPAQQAAPPEPDVAHYLAREREQPMRWLVTPPEAAAQFQPTPAWLAQHSLLEVLPHATPTPAN